MSEPTTREYALYFELTKDYLEQDIIHSLQQLQSSGPHGQPRKDSDKPSEQCDDLIDTFNKAAKQHLSHCTDGFMCASQDVTRFLASCQPIPATTRSELIQNLLPERKRIQDLKLPIPLLIISGGDVDRDVRRIRRGVDLNQVLEDIQDDWKNTQDSAEPSMSSDTSAFASMPAMVREQVEKALHAAGAEVTTTSLRFLRSAMAYRINQSEVYKACALTLPTKEDRGAALTSTLFEDELDLGVDNEVVRESSEPTISDSDGLAAFVKQEPDLLSRLDDALDKNIGDTSDLVTNDEMMRELLKEFTNHDFCDSSLDNSVGNYRDEPPDRGKSTDQANTLYDIPQPSLRLAGLKGFESAAETSFYNCTGKDTNQTRLAFMHDNLNYPSRKINLKQLDCAPDLLPPHNHEHLLQGLQARSDVEACSELNVRSNLDCLPFKVPQVQDVLREPVLVTSSFLDRIAGRSKKILTSKDLLWKGEQLRLFDRNEDEQEAVTDEDYCIDDPEINDIAPGSQLEAELVDSNKSSTNECKDRIKQEEQPHANPSLNLKTRSTEIRDKLSCPRVTPGSVKQEDHVPVALKTIPAPGSSSKKSLQRSDDVSIRQMKRKFKEESKQAEDQQGSTYFTTQKQTWGPKNLKPRKLSTKPTGFASDSLYSFLDLRGKKFKVPALPNDTKGAGIPEDPIQSTPDEPQVIPRLENDSYKVVKKDKSIVANTGIPQWLSLGGARTIVVNNSLLQQKPLLIRYLERAEPDLLKLVYRDLDLKNLRGPDLILSATSCLMITNLQALDQRPLPGQSSDTGLSRTHDDIARLAQRYGQVVVLVHYINPRSSNSCSNFMPTFTQFVSYCRNISQAGTESSAKVYPVWLPCETPASTSDVVNAWTWRVVREYGLGSKQGWQIPCMGDVLLRDETLWELFLREADINPLAAQVMLALLKKVEGEVLHAYVNNDLWGLRRLVAMSEHERMKIFEGIVGPKTLGRLNSFLRSKVV